MFFGNFVNSLLDHMFGPAALSSTLRSSGPLYKSAKRLQLINEKRLADHALTHAIFKYILQHSGFNEENDPGAVCPGLSVKWDYDAIMRALREGEAEQSYGHVRA